MAAQAGAVHETTGRGPICKMHEPLSLSSCQSGNNANKVLTVDDAKLQEAVKEEHLSNPYTDIMQEAKIADQHAAQPCQTAQHDIKKEPNLTPAPTTSRQMYQLPSLQLTFAKKYLWHHML
ncbi:TPA: hypothetical protein ACH3X3_012850 [Trebouxia sp. C0006]